MKLLEVYGDADKVVYVNPANITQAVIGVWVHGSSLYQVKFFFDENNNAHSGNFESIAHAKQYLIDIGLL